MPTTPSKESQEAEAADRARNNGSAVTEGADALLTEADITRPDPAPRAAPALENPDIPEPGPRQPPRSLHDDRRNSIVARFREDRESENTGESDEDQIRNFARQGLPPEMLPEPVATAPVEEPVATEEVAADAPVVDAPVETAPTKRTLKIRGKEVQVTEDELIAAAQRSLAGDDYLDEARQRLERVRALERDVTQSRSPRGDQPTTHPGGTQPAQTTEPQAINPDVPEHPEGGRRLIEAIHYGNPDEAEAAINTQITTTATTAAKEALQAERLRNEGLRSQRNLKEFRDKHADLASDPFATRAMEGRLYELQREDLVKIAVGLGHDESQVPTAPAEIAKWHLFYRTEGHEVRDVPTLLNQTRDDFLEWRDKSAPKPTPTATPAATPRVNVQVDRTARRTVIQPQPSRTVTPRPDAQNQPIVPRDRSDVVRQMAANRARARGQVAG